MPRFTTSPCSMLVPRLLPRKVSSRCSRVLGELVLCLTVFFVTDLGSTVPTFYVVLPELVCCPCTTNYKRLCMWSCVCMYQPSTHKSAQVRQGLLWWIWLNVSTACAQESLEHYILSPSIFHFPFIYGHNIWPSVFLDLMSCGRLAMNIFFQTKCRC